MSSSEIPQAHNPLRPGITLPELVKVCDAAAAELVTPPLSMPFLVRAVGPVRGRLMFTAVVVYLMLRDEARVDGTSVTEQVSHFGVGLCVLACLSGLVFDGVPVRTLLAVTAALVVVNLAGAAVRYMSGGDER
jgi:hypothetical protein